MSVHEVGRQDETVYIVSDLIEGLTLSDWLSAQQLTPREAAELCAKLADTLNYAHEQGVIHRDIKPGNIMLDGRGEPHVMDFGLAKREAGEITMTVEGRVLGTPAYMSPEQAKGEGHQADRRSDVYSLGVVLFQLLTGELPFRGTTRMLLYQVLNEEPKSPRALNDRVPRDLETICLKCLEKEPEKRYPTAGELRDDLRRHLVGEPIVARPIGSIELGWRWCKRKPAVASLTVAMLLLLAFVAVASAIAAVTIAQSRQNTLKALEGAQAARTEAETKRQEAEEAREREALASGRAVALAAKNRQSLVRLHVSNGAKLLDQGDSTAALVWFTKALQMDDSRRAKGVHRLRISATLGECTIPTQMWHVGVPVRSASFSPDRRYIMAVANRPLNDNYHVWVWDVGSGDNVADIAVRQKVDFALFSPDSRFVAVASDAHYSRFENAVEAVEEESEVLVWDLENDRQVYEPLPHAMPVHCIAYSPDGKLLVTASGNSEYADADTGETRLWDASTGELLGRHPHPFDVLHVEFSADGRRLVTSGGNSRFVGERGEAILWDAATFTPVKTGIDAESVVYQARFSPDGNRIATATYGRGCRIWERETGNAVTERLEPVLISKTVCFSPDGRYVAATGDYETAGLWDAESGRLVATLKHPGWAKHAEFSPDGSALITATSDRNRRRSEAIIWNASSGEPLLKLSHGGPLNSAAFGPGGSHAVTCSDDGTVRVWRVAAATHRQVRQYNAITHAAYSPDGRTCAIVGLDGVAMLCDPRAGGAYRQIDAKIGALTSVAFDGAAQLLLLCGHPRIFGPGLARTFSANTGAPVSRIVRHVTPIKHAILSGDGRLVLTTSDSVKLVRETSSRPGEVKLWSAEVGDLAAPVYQHLGSVVAAKFGTNGDPLIALLSKESDLELRNVRDETVRHVELPSNTSLVHATFASGSKMVLVLRESPSEASQEPGFYAQFWDADRHVPISEPMRHAGGIKRAIPSPDGLSLVTIHDDQTARIWDSRSYLPRSSLLRHDLQITHAAFSQDSRLLVTCSADHTVRVWDARVGEPITGRLKHRHEVSYAAFSPGSDQLVTCVGAPGLYVKDAIRGGAVWRELVPAEQPVDDLVSLAELIAERTVDEFGAMVPLPEKQLTTMWRTSGMRLLEAVSSETNSESQFEWHRDQAEESQIDNRMFAAVWHLSRAIELRPGRWDLKAQRADANSERMLWEEAVLDYSAAIDARPESSELRERRGFAYANLDKLENALRDYELLIAAGNVNARVMADTCLLRLANGDIEGYRRGCGELLKQFGGVQHADIAFTVMSTCLLRPLADEDHDQLLKLAQRWSEVPSESKLGVLELPPKRKAPYIYHWGAALVRDSQFDDAVRRLAEAVKLSGGTNAAELLFLAMAQQAIGDDAAPDSMRVGAALAQKTTGADSKPGTWRKRLELKMLLEEATEMLSIGQGRL